MKKGLFLFALISIVFLNDIQAAKPTISSSGVTTSSVGTSTINIYWTSGNGLKRIVTCGLASGSPAVPTDDVNYNANASFGSGSHLGGGNYCVYNGSGSSCAISGLTAGTQYRIRIYEYNVDVIPLPPNASFENYLTSSYANYLEYTVLTEPTTQASAINVTNITTSVATISFTPGNGTSNLLALRPATTYTNTPVDGTEYVSSFIYGNGSAIAGTPPSSYVIYDGALTTLTANSLSPGTNYTAAVFAFNGSNGTNNYRLTSYPTKTFTTLAAEPTSASSNISFSNITNNSMTVSWTIPQSGAGSYHLVTCKAGNSNTDLPSDATYYIPGATFGTGNQVGGTSGAYAVYWGQENEITVTGLSASSNYTFAIFECNTVTNTYNNTYNYLTTSYLSGTQSTLIAEPSTPSSNLTFSSIGPNSVKASWANGNGSKRLVGVNSGRKHTALSFDGVNDAVTIPNESTFDFTNAMTVEAWIKVESFTVADQAIITKGDNSWSLTRNGTTNALQFRYIYDFVGFKLQNSVYGSMNVNDGKWHHVAAVFNGSQLGLYIDGCLDAYSLASSNIDNGNYQVYIGGNAQTPGKNFHGQIDEVRIWNVGLAINSIRNNMNKALNGNENGLVGYWKFDDGFALSAVAANSSFTSGINGSLFSFNTTAAASDFTRASGWVHSGATVNCPLDFGVYLDNKQFMSNTNGVFYYGNLAYVVYKGSDSTSITVSNLSPNSWYTFSVFDFNGNVADNNYLTSNYAIAEVQTTAATAPAITSFNPTSGFVGDLVTINGSGFNITAANNTVYFGGVKAPIVSVNGSGTQLVVRVPFGASYNLLSVTNNSLTGYSTKPFVVTSPCGSSNFSGTTYNAASTIFSYGPKDLRMADVDLDGYADLVAVENTYIDITRNISTPTSTAFAGNAVFVSTANAINNDVDIADMDGDGKLDFVSSNANSTKPSIIAFRNNSTPSNISFGITKEFLCLTGTSPTDIAIADLDKDGKPDVIVSNANNTISYFKNTSSIGNISFASRVDITLDPGATNNALAIGDIDGDGKLDIAIAGGATLKIYYLRNTSTVGSISFAAFTSTTLTGSISAVAIGDIDSDTKSDILFATGTSTVGILKNNSTINNISISASPTNIVTLANTPIDIKVGDIDGDNKADIAVGYSSGTQVSIFKNNSTVSFSIAAKNDFTLAAAAITPTAIALNDINNDGKLDLISNSNAQSPSLFINNINPLASEPTVQSSSLNFSNLSTSQITLNFTAGNGANRIVFVRSQGTIIQYPADGVSYVPNTIFGNGEDLGGGNYCVYDGNSNTVTVTGLQSNTNYIFSVYEYNGATNCQYNYLLNGTNNHATQPTNNTTPTLNPIANPSSICQNSGLQTINLSGISSGSGSENQSLTVKATSNNIGLIPNPTVNYTSPNTTGSISYTPVNGVSGTAIITVTVDDGASNNYLITRNFTVTVDAFPTTASAGPDQEICPAVGSLAGNTPANGTGLWTIYTTTNGTISITSNTNPTSTVNNFNINDSARFIWTVTNGACPVSRDTVKIKRKNCPTTADFTVNQSSACLNGSPVFTFTDASIASGGNITNWSWNFGAGAFPASASTQGPHVVTYSTSGPKTVSLQVTDNLNVTDIEIKASFVNVNDVPDPAGNISGSTTVCQGQTGVNYSVPAINNATGYTWNLPTGATIISGINTNQITVDFANNAISGNISVRGTNACGNGTLSANFPVTINPLPNAAGNITGNTSVCDSATGVPFSISSITNASSYSWTVPSGATILTGGGTNSITVNFAGASQGGLLTVYGVNACGNGDSTSINISISPYPDAAGIITGLTSITNCPSTLGVTYSIPLVNYATSYNWTVPSGINIISGTGTNNITVDYTSTAVSGNITVTPVNSCGNGPSAVLPVIVNTLPDNAGLISGIDTIDICPASDSVVYSIASLFNATHYIWSLPAGATIISGDSTNSIMVNYAANAVSGLLTVYGENACGKGDSSSLYINVLQVPMQHICLVTVDDVSNYNKIIWERDTLLKGIDSVNIYREIASVGFTKVASVHYDSLSEYTDNAYIPLADPNITNYRYKISLVDSCGNESVLSNHHRTVFLQANQGVGNVVNLTWVPYEGDSVSLYQITRDTLGNGIFDTIGVVPGANYVYTDLYPPFNASNLRYRLETVWNTTCTSTTRGTPINTSRSNIKQIVMTSIGDQYQTILDNNIKIYPNPANEYVMLEYPVGFKKYQVQVFDALGQLVIDKQLSDDGNYNGILRHQLDVSYLTKGVYFISVITDYAKTVKRVIIQ